MNESVSAEAQVALGHKEGSDWILDPESHAKKLPPKAGPLIRILESDAIKEIMKKYVKADAEAARHQKVYKKWGQREIKLTLYATIVGALFLLPVWGLETPPFIKWLGVLMQFLLLSVVFSISLWLAWRKPFEQWMTNRGEAEIARINIFKNVMNAKETPGAGELPLLPLKLEYFRRYQFDVQRSYYKERGKQHKIASGQTSVLKWMKRLFLFIWGIIVLAAFSFIIVTFLGKASVPDVLKWLDISQLPDKSEVWVLAMGIIVSAFYSQRASHSLMNMDVRNAARYKVVSDNLEELHGGLEQARIAATKGDEEAVRHFVKSIHKQISSEHREWILLRPLFTPQQNKDSAGSDTVEVAIGG